MGETRLGEFEEILLLLVGILDEEAYALHLEEEYASQTGKSTSIGAVHSTLSRLEKKGFLTSEMGAPTARRGGRRKRIYKVTALGDSVLQQTRSLRMTLWNQYPGFSGSSFTYG